MKLAQFIQTRMEPLLQDWEDAVLEIAPELTGEGSRALRDHAHSMLEFICRDLATAQTRDESVRQALGETQAPASAEHALDRVKQGLSMFQMVQEFRALRARVSAAWGKEKRSFTEDDIAELVQFNEAIDQLIANSVSRFSALKEQGTRLIETMLKASPDPAAIFDRDAKLLFTNTAMADLVNASPRDLIGRTPRELGLDFAVELQEEVAATVTSGKSQRRQFHCRSPSGRELDFDCQLVPVFDDQNNVEAVVTNSLDITESKQAEYQVWRNANYDSLTGLPNRRLFMDRLEHTLLEANERAALLQCYSSTWTASSKPTTSSATGPATGFWQRWPNA